MYIRFSWHRTKYRLSCCIQDRGVWKATGNKNAISDEDDSSAPEESTDTSVTNPDDAQNTTDTNPSGGGHSTDSSTDSTIDGNVPQGTEDISGGTISAL